MSIEKYADILYREHPQSNRRVRMTTADRAAQFSPFAALTGFDAVIAETARLTASRIELDASRQEELNAQLQRLFSQIHTYPLVSITYFQADGRKEGGAYLRATGNVRNINSYTGRVVFLDGREIPICEIVQIEGNC